MESYIQLENVRFFAYHGVFGQERKVGNNFEINIKVKSDFKVSIESDALTDTISYADIYNILEDEMRTPSHLIEHVAGRIVRKLQLIYPQILGIELKLSKINPPISGDVEKASVIIIA